VPSGDRAVRAWGPVGALLTTRALIGVALSAHVRYVVYMTTTTDPRLNPGSAIHLAHEHGSILDAPYTHADLDWDTYRAEGDIDITDPRLARVDRIRLLTEAGYPRYDVSYVYGTLRDGRHVRVTLAGHHTLPRTIRSGRLDLMLTDVKRALIGIAKETGVYAKGLGMLDDAAISILA
jgi:hypothetical protein